MIRKLWLHKTCMSRPSGDAVTEHCDGYTNYCLSGPKHQVMIIHIGMWIAHFDHVLDIGQNCSLRYSVTQCLHGTIYIRNISNWSKNFGHTPYSTRWGHSHIQLICGSYKGLRDTISSITVTLLMVCFPSNQYHVCCRQLSMCIQC